MHQCADARDLLQRMLAPENTRASFDLVMFHPWLKPYNFWAEQSMPSEKGEAVPKKRKKRSRTKRRTKKALRLLRKVITFIIKGPYPPPDSYYDLVDKRYRQ